MNTAQQLNYFAPPPVQPQPTKRSWRVPIAIASLILIPFFAFWGVEQGEFLNIDDNEYVTENEYVRAGLTWPGITWAWTSAHSGHWHPLTWMSHMLDVTLFGLDPRAPHLVNLLLHSIAMIGLFLFLLKATHAFWRSLFVALFIAINPLRLESVAWVAERKDVLSTAFAMWTLVAYLHYVRSPSVVRYCTVGVTLLCGLLAKPMLVSIPLVLLLLDYWPLNRFSSTTFRRLFSEKIPLFLIALGVAVAAVLAQSTGGALQGLSNVSLGDRVASASTAYLIYLGKFLWPFNRSIYFPLRPLPSGLAAGAAFFIVGFTLLCWRSARSRPFLIVGCAWFLITLIPVIGVVQVGMQQVADRWTYLPHVGLAIAGGWFAAEFASTAQRRRTVSVLAIGVIAGLSIATRQGVPDWRTSENIFTHALRNAPENFFAHANLAAVLETQGRTREAQHHYEESLRFNPVYGVALNNLGSLRARAGSYDEAIQLFECALASHPNFLPARYHLGLAREMLGQHLRAIEAWVTVLIVSPNYERARESLAFVVKAKAEMECSALVRSARDSAEDAKQLRELLGRWSPQARDSELKAQIVTMSHCWT